jgi:hypothetical protein
MERGKNMKGMIFKKVFLLGGIFLLATFMSVQLSWSCDDDDKWDRDCRDQWNCDHHCWSCNPPKIQRVFLEFKPAPDTSDTSEPFIRFSIWGKNFDDGAPPVVTLGGEFDLTVTSYSHDYIQATLPMSVEEDFDYGDYRLVVSTCYDSRCKYCKDYCSKCKDRHCRDYCSKCKDKYCKNKYCKEDEHKCRCKDRYSLTIANPSVPTSAIGLKIESKQVVLNSKEVISRTEVNVECGSGFAVTGGGFSCLKCVECPDCVRIALSEPLQDDKKNGIGWHVIATYMVPFEMETIELAVHAICARVP